MDAMKVYTRPVDGTGKPEWQSIGVTHEPPTFRFEPEYVVLPVTCSGTDDAGKPVWQFEFNGVAYEYHGPMIWRNGVIDESITFTPVDG